MVASLDIAPAAAGRATLEVGLVSGQSAVTSAFATSPLKLLTPRSRGQSVWAYTSSFGGGLVAGDQTRLDLRLGAGAKCFVGTQASTKIYRNPALLPSGHVTRATLEEDSLLVFAPDPVQAFADSTYTQRQEFHLGPGAGLVLVDWFTSGRAARGERWAFNRFHSRNEVTLGAPASLPASFRAAALPAGMPALPGCERIFLDSLLLDQRSSALSSAHRLGRFNCVALLLFLGPPVREAVARLLESISTQPVTRRGPLLCSASPIRDGAMLRLAAESVEEAGRELHRHLAGVAGLLGDDPWARKG